MYSVTRPINSMTIPLLARVLTVTTVGPSMEFDNDFVFNCSAKIYYMGDQNVSHFTMIMMLP